MKKLLLIIWCLPQAILGSIVYLYFKLKYRSKMLKGIKDNITYYEVPSSSKLTGVSLYPFIFVNHDGVDDVTIHHEHGHLKQSLLYSWLYLIIVGIPSGTSNIPFINKLIRGRKYNTEYQYYTFPWEKQADKFGNIKQTIPSKGNIVREVTG